MALASNDNSYLKEYVRRQDYRLSPEERGRSRDPRAGKLLTDRNEYVSWLESQLDAVTQACLVAQSFDERITALGTSACVADEKMLNLARLIKCSQSVAEEQESAYHYAMVKVSERVTATERAVHALTHAEERRVLMARKMLDGKGLKGGDGAGGVIGGAMDDGGGMMRGGGGAMAIGVLDAQFRVWASAHERSVDARIDAAEQRLAARVDTATANVLDALRATEQRLKDAAPRLAEEATRRVWGAGPERGAFPTGGVAGVDALRHVVDRVEALEAMEAKLKRELRVAMERAEDAADEARRFASRERWGGGGGGRSGAAAGGSDEYAFDRASAGAGPGPGPGPGVR